MLTVILSQRVANSRTAGVFNRNASAQMALRVAWTRRTPLGCHSPPARSRKHRRFNSERLPAASREVRENLCSNAIPDY